MAVDVDMSVDRDAHESALDDIGNEGSGPTLERGPRRNGGVSLAITIGVAAVIGIGSLCGWLGMRYSEAHREHQDAVGFLQAGRQAAVNLTTISHAEVDVDVQRILDSATGAFRDDFQKRSQPFIDLVRQARSETTGTVTEAGLASQEGSHAQVLVAVSVETSNAGVAEQNPRLWRMRIDVDKVGDDFKISNVQFVP